jgi:protein-tyrosine phosphatase
MIDLHNHLLGENELESGVEGALALCEQARRDGVKEIVVTLRVAPDGERVKHEVYERRLEELRERIDGHLNLSRGYEWVLSADLLSRLRRFAGTPTINESSYLLVSFPSLPSSISYEAVMTELVDEGYVPIVTHPECSRMIRRDASAISNLIKLGALIQVDALSLLGGYGKEVESFARRLLERGEVHFIATRASQEARREVSLKAARARASQIIGQRAARPLVEGNPEAVIGNTVITEIPARGRRLPALKAALTSWG